MKINNKQKITLQEINNFRILSSSPPKYTQLPPIIILKDIEIDKCLVDYNLIKQIFLKLKMKNGGKIWVNSNIIIEGDALNVFLGNHKILSLDKFQPRNKVNPGNYSIPIALDTFFYKDFPGIEEFSLHNISSSYLDNHSYNFLRDVNFRIHPEYHLELTRKYTPTESQDKYFKTLEKLGLPISFNESQTAYIISDITLKEPLLKDEMEYKKLYHFASFISKNNLASEKFNDIFGPFYKESVQILTSDTNIINCYYTLKKNYKNELNKKSYLHKLQSVIEGKERINWEKSGLTFQSLFKSLAPLIALYATCIPAFYIVSISDFNTNFAFSALTPGVISQILYNFSFYLALSIVLLVGFTFSPYIVQLVEKFIKYILRIKEINNKRYLGKLISFATYLGVALIIFLISTSIDSKSLQILIYAISLPPSLILIFKAAIQFFIEDFIYTYKSLARVIIFLIPVFLIAVTGSLATDNKSLLGQSCSYLYYADTQQSYYYRYFETNSWENSTEIAILPGSSSSWIDGTKIDVPTKITVSKGDLMSLNSCTDKVSSWTTVENTFKMDDTAAKYGYIKSTYQKVSPPYSSIDKMPPYATPFILKHKAMNNM